MALLDEEPSAGRGPVIWVVLLGLAGAVAAVAWLWLREPEAPPAAARRETPAVTEVPGPATRPPVPEVEPRRAPERRRPVEREEAPAPEPAPETKPSGVLRVKSDVTGASVFLDRKFLGNTPLEVDGLTPGAHRLNVSADGYEGHAQQVDIGEAPAEVEVRFREVRLDTAIPVVHKHGMGSCSGRLVASVAGLRYDTANRSDAFTMPFAELEGFAVDYLKKNLRVKRRGGKTWNFEDPAGNADALFVFHRDVDKARQRLTAP